MDDLFEEISPERLKSEGLFLMPVHLVQDWQRTATMKWLDARVAKIEAEVAALRAEARRKARCGDC